MSTKESSTTSVDAGILGHEHGQQITSDTSLEQPPGAPPVSETHMLQTLVYTANSEVNPTVSISAVIDKGFFLADDKWTCYRRNYFSCICSYNIYPSVDVSNFQLIDLTSGEKLGIRHLAIRIAAAVDQNDPHAIELVQHTSKKENGPIDPPKYVYLDPETQTSSRTLFSAGSVDRKKGLYTQPFQFSSPQSPSTEHRFERIQFKQATANNGKRRAAQQYYRLVFELCAEVDAEGGKAQFIPVARATSVGLVVRGRSPGHYESERKPRSTIAQDAALDSGRLLNEGQTVVTHSHTYEMLREKSRMAAPAKYLNWTFGGNHATIAHKTKEEAEIPSTIIESTPRSIGKNIKLAYETSD